MEKENIWSKDTCTCGYWIRGKYSGKKNHDNGCLNHIHDNTPNAIKLMKALRTISKGQKVKTKN